MKTNPIIPNTSHQIIDTFFSVSVDARLFTSKYSGIELSEKFPKSWTKNENDAENQRRHLNWIRTRCVYFVWFKEKKKPINQYVSNCVLCRHLFHDMAHRYTSSLYKSQYCLQQSNRIAIGAWAQPNIEKQYIVKQWKLPANKFPSSAVLSSCFFASLRQITFEWNLKDESRRVLYDLFFCSFSLRKMFFSSLLIALDMRSPMWQFKFQMRGLCKSGHEFARSLSPRNHHSCARQRTFRRSDVKNVMEFFSCCEWKWRSE